MKGQSSIWNRFVHSPWMRMVVGAVMAAAVWVVVGIVYDIFVRNAVPADYRWLATVIVRVVSALLTMVCYVWLYRKYESRSITELSVRSMPANAWKGFLVGLAIPTASMLVLIACCVYRVTGLNSSTVLIIPFLGAVAAAVFEEVVFRGIFFRLIEEKLGTWIALLVSALFFGLAHIVNPGATLVNTLAIALQAGLLLGLAYVMTRSLWFPIFLHLANNFVGNGVFSTPDGQGWLAGEFPVRHWLIGGGFGTESSPVIVAVCLLIAVWMYLRSRKLHRFVLPYWKRPSVSL